jgi:thymidylate synthase ThyX
MRQTMGYDAKVLCDSLSPDNVRLTTLEVTFPRIVLAEFNTHRMFSRNSASSRAIPVEKMINRVLTDPFIPVYWGKNQKGMQAEEELTEDLRLAAEETWLAARDHAVYRVNQMLALGIHKQIANRLLEPWLYHTAIVTATEWDNFWGLRCNKDAQPEIRKAADLMRAAYDASPPSPVNYGDWHLPLVEPDEAFNLQANGMSIEDVCRMSVGRCARVSYLTHDGVRDPKADVELCERLAKSGHMSPLEHVARPMTWEEAYALHYASAGRRDPFSEFRGNFRGWVQMRKLLPYEANFLARPTS